MFEIDKEEQEFNYSLLSNELAEKIKEKDYILIGLHSSYSKEVGKVLYEAQQDFSDYNNGGLFEKWYTSRGFKKQNVYNYINIYNEVQNLDSDQLEVFEKLPKSLQIETSKKNSDPELKKKVLDGDITTHKQYKTVLKEKQEAEKRAEQAEQQLKEEQSKEPKVVEKVIEIDNTDYEGINNLEKEKRQVEEKMNSIKLELEEIKLNNSEVSKLKEDLKKLNRTRDDLLSSIDVAKIVGEFSANTDNYIDGELSRIMRPDNFDEIISSKPLFEVTDKKIQALRLMIEEYDMKRNNYKLNSDIIDVEIT